MSFTWGGFSMDTKFICQYNAVLRPIVHRLNTADYTCLRVLIRSGVYRHWFTAGLF